MKEQFGMNDRRHETLGETTITVKWWSVLMVIILALGFFFTAFINHETRITRTEEACKSITEIKVLVKEIREDQIRRYRDASHKN